MSTGPPVIGVDEAIGWKVPEGSGHILGQVNIDQHKGGGRSSMCSHSDATGAFPFAEVDDPRLILLSAGLDARAARVGNGDRRLSRYGSNRSSGDVVDDTPLAADGAGGDEAVLVPVVVLACDAVDSVPVEDDRWRLDGEEPTMIPSLADILRIGETGPLVDA